MALRLIEMILPKDDADKIEKLIQKQNVLEQRKINLSEKEILIRILLDAENSESVLDMISKQCGSEAKRVVMLPVQAIVPREDIETEEKNNKKANGKKRTYDRISRDELYESIIDAAGISTVYLIMTLLSAVVATVGLEKNSVAVIIGAMVIAPLLGPNMALALGTTLGDLPLVRRAFFTGIAGYGAAIAMSVILGLIIPVEPITEEIAIHTQAGIGDLSVAIASGCAGALAFTTGMSAILIGVMVAVSLLPPLVTAGLLLGSGHLNPAMGALSLFLMNLFCINLAAIVTFLAQGIRPANWWEKKDAAKATKIAIILWVVLLAALILLIWLEGYYL